MIKNICCIALTLALAAAYALPASARATEEDIPLHLLPEKPQFTGQVIGGEGFLSNTSGIKVFCGHGGVSGTMTFETGSSGTMQLTFIGSGETKPLPFHLLTLPNNKPGILVTPNAGGSFLPCGLFFSATGNGLVGTITSPKCSETSTELGISFRSAGTGVQEHKVVEGTATEYHLALGMTAASLDVSLSVILKEQHKLVCT